MEKVIPIFSGNSNRNLAWEIFRLVNPGFSEKDKNDFDSSIPGLFPDGEIDVKLKKHLRGERAYIIQSICESVGNGDIRRTVNDNLVELLLIADAARRASCEGITCVIPYFGYGRQDKKVEGRVPISARVVSDILSESGVDRIVTVDLHAAQIQGFLNIPVDNLYSLPVIVPFLKNELKLLGPDVVVVSPDVGGVRRAEAYQEALKTEIAFLLKERIGPTTVNIKDIIGNVRGKRCLIVDDIISTGGTLVEAAKFLEKKGAEEVVACATHALFCGNAPEKLMSPDVKKLTKVVVTDTIPMNKKWGICSKPEVKYVSVAGMLADVIASIQRHESLSEYIKGRMKKI